MKKVILWSVLSMAVLACAPNQKPAEAPSKSADAKALYEKNLAALQQYSCVRKRANRGVASSVVDNAKWHPPPMAHPSDKRGLEEGSFLLCGELG